MKNYEHLIKHECKRQFACLKRGVEYHLGCSSPKDVSSSGRKCEEERGYGLILACGTDRPTKCYFGLYACVAWLLLTEYLERFTAILPLENVSLLPATTSDRWQYIGGQIEKRLALHGSAMLDKKSFVYLLWNCMSRRNRRAVSVAPNDVFVSLPLESHIKKEQKFIVSLWNCIVRKDLRCRPVAWNFLPLELYTSTETEVEISNWLIVPSRQLKHCSNRQTKINQSLNLRNKYSLFFVKGCVEGRVFVFSSSIILVKNPPPAPGSLFLGVASHSASGRDLPRVPKPNSISGKPTSRSATRHF